MIDRPLFKDIQSAIRWGWYGWVDDANTVRGATYLSLRPKGKKKGRVDDEEEKAAPPHRDENLDPRPKGYDACAQAGLIKAAVATLPEVGMCHVMAKFLIGQERALARKHLQPLILDRLDMSTNKGRWITSLLLARVYGKRGLTINSIAETTKTSRRRVTALNKKLLAEMDAVSVNNENSLYYVLQRMGVVQ